MHTLRYQEIIEKENKETGQSRFKKQDKRNMEGIINRDAFVIQHETEYYHCWTDRAPGRSRGRKNEEIKKKN